MRLIVKGGLPVDMNREVEFECMRCGCVWREAEYEVYGRQVNDRLRYRSVCPECGLPNDGGERKEVPGR